MTGAPEGASASRFTARLGGREVLVVTRPGFPGWERVSRAEELLAAEAEIAPGERVVVWPCGHGALGVWAAGPAGAGRVRMCDTNVLAVDAARATADLNAGPSVEVVVGVPGEGGVADADVVLLRLPKGRQFARLGLLAAFAALRPGGRLYVAGANAEGIKSAAKDAAALFGGGTLLSYKGGNRALAFTRPAALPDPLPDAFREPGIAPGTRQELTVELPGGEAYTFLTRPGVFSWRALDEGTRLLLSVLAGRSGGHVRSDGGVRSDGEIRSDGYVRGDDRVLDVGCGYGAIGIWVARRAPAGHVTMVDVDWLAVQAARESAARNAVANAEVLLAGSVSAVADRGPFTLVVSNPPFHSGHATDLDIAAGFIREAHAALAPRGRLILVANRFLPYDRLMAERFRRVRVLADTPRYWVLAATRRARRVS